MKRFLWILVGIMLMGVTFSILYFASAIYDAGDQMHIEPYVFQPNNLSSRRIGVPMSIDQMKDSEIMDALVKKFVTEYFYVTPDIENISRRKRRGGILSLMASGDVYNQWVDGVVPELEQMAGDKMLRTVRVANQIFKPQGSDYWTVAYELKTWDVPNDMAATPVIERGVLYLKIAFEKQLRDQMHGTPFNVREYLDNGGDPAAIFNFRVDAVVHGRN